jgi:hypothetical protein
VGRKERRVEVVDVMSMFDLTLRQRLLKLRYAFVRDLSVSQIQVSKVGQPFEVLQPFIGHLGASPQVQVFELGEAFNALQPRIGYLRVVQQVKRVEISQPVGANLGD